MKGTRLELEDAVGEGGWVEPAHLKTVLLRM